VDQILTTLGRRPSDATIALVGHEPTLSMILARLLGASDSERLAFKKGGAALVDLPDGPSAGGQLVWFLKPKVLRALAGD
jgi:phosphohistidine phosphatase